MLRRPTAITHPNRRHALYAVTADVRLSIRQSCEECGMNGFITKPIDENGLRAVIEETLREKLKVSD